MHTEILSIPVHIYVCILQPYIGYCTYVCMLQSFTSKNICVHTEILPQCIYTSAIIESCTSSVCDCVYAAATYWYVCVHTAIMYRQGCVPHICKLNLINKRVCDCVHAANDHELVHMCACCNHHVCVQISIIMYW